MNRISRRKFIFNSLILSGSLLFLEAYFLEKLWVKYSKHRITDQEEKNALCLVQISDLHLNTIGYRHKKIAQTINGIKADLLIFTGDSIDKKENLPLLKDFLNLLSKEIPKVAILGNWEYWGRVDINALGKLYADFNCDLLINESKEYKLRDQHLSITGLDDFLGGKADYLKAIRNLKKENKHIVLNHCPQYTDRIRNEKKEESIDLILSGHTHGGQFNLFGFAPFKPPGSGRYLSGWYQNEKAPMYVSQGIGTSILPFRFGARAEIATFYL